MTNLNSLGKRDKRIILRNHRGILARVARELGVTPQGVRLVWWGTATSARIEAALNAELAAITPSMEQRA